VKQQSRPQMTETEKMDIEGVAHGQMHGPEYEQPAQQPITLSIHFLKLHNFFGGNAISCRHNRILFRCLSQRLGNAIDAPVDFLHIEPTIEEGEQLQ